MCRIQRFPGGTRVFAMVIGFMLSGYLMGKYKPRPRIILGWNVFLGFLHVGSDLFHIFLRCDDNGLYGLDINNGKLDIYNDCNMNCACEAVKYQPVCYQFGDCSCVPSHITVPFNYNDMPEVPTFLNDTSAVTIMNGPCPVDCTKIIVINIVVGFTISILSSLGRVGSVVVNFR
ncbi:unnamed protein product [Timema podura]|uniref:Uncharacterized protein n=1 Tax=Timema podura TaxID=61482 RepID=A0ABN7PE95_TIMPD|nr:unnamed protein product [Timema podura]